MNALTEQRLNMLRNGYTPLPANGKAVWLVGWTTMPVAEADIHTWAAEHSDCRNTGLRTGAVCAIDIDVLDAGLSKEIEWAATFSLGHTPLRRVGKAPKVTLLYRAADPTTGKAETAECILPNGTKAQVEALGAKHQTIAFGIHPDTKQRYTWNGVTPEDVPLANLPVVTAAEVAEFLDEATRILLAAGAVIKAGSSSKHSTKPAGAGTSARGLQGDIADAAAAVEVIPNIGPAGWVRWTEIGMAIYGATGGSDEGLELYEKWSALHPDNGVKYTAESRWNSFHASPPTEKGIGSLIYEARQACPGWQPPSQAPTDGAEFNGIDAPDDLDDEPDDTVADDTAADDTAADDASETPLQLIHPADCETGPRRAYVVKHLLAEGNVGALIGPPGTGKSMLAPYIAYAVAQGRSAFGLRTKQGRTLYVAAEDGAGMRQRIHALKLNHGDAPEFAMTECGNLSVEADVKALCRTVAIWKPVLVIIDTLAAAWAGISENESEGMGQVVRVTRAMARETGCAVLLIHHTAKQSDGTPRGHSSLNGTLDMSLCLEPRDQAGVIRGKLSKNRNGTTDRDIAFRYVAVELGRDEDGDVVTAPMAVELNRTGAEPERRQRPTATEQRAMDILHGMAVASGGEVSEADWRAECVDRGVSTSEEPRNRAKIVARLIRTLLDKRLVEVKGGKAWVCGVEPAGTKENSQEPGGTSEEPKQSNSGGTWNQRNHTPRGGSSSSPTPPAYDDETQGASPTPTWTPC